MEFAKKSWAVIAAALEGRRFMIGGTAATLFSGAAGIYGLFTLNRVVQGIIGAVLGLSVYLLFFVLKYAIALKDGGVAKVEILDVENPETIPDIYTERLLTVRNASTASIENVNASIAGEEIGRLAGVMFALNLPEGAPSSRTLDPGGKISFRLFVVQGNSPSRILLAPGVKGSTPYFSVKEGKTIEVVVTGKDMSPVKKKLLIKSQGRNVRVTPAT